MCTFLEQEKNKGGVLITVLCLLTILTTVYLFFLEDQTYKQKFLSDTKDYYLSETLIGFAKEEIKTQKITSAQHFTYNIGDVDIIPPSSGRYYQIKIQLKNGYKRSLYEANDERSLGINNQASFLCANALKKIKSFDRMKQ